MFLKLQKEEEGLVKLRKFMEAEIIRKKRSSKKIRYEKKRKK